MIGQFVLFLALPILSLATLSTTCITAVDQLKPIHASFIVKALESAEFPQVLTTILSTAKQFSLHQLLKVAKAIESKIIWDIPTSKEAEVYETLMKLLPKVYARGR